MKRRNFLSSTVAALFGTLTHRWFGSKARAKDAPVQLPRRLFKDDVHLSVIGFGGIVVMGMEQAQADAIVAESYDQGINYYDVAPSYGDGEVEHKMGIALKPFRKNVFLACKTTQRDARGARAELEQSLTRLHTDYFDLYQFHAVTTLPEVEQIFAPGGAVETFEKARQEGMIRYIGFSAHSVEAALAMLDRFDFDSILFPVNFVCYGQGNFGPQVVQKAKEKGVARLALKALAYTPWPEGMARNYRKCWYRPVDEIELAAKALGFTLSEDITSAIPPGEEALFRMAVKLAGKFEAMSPEAREALLAGTEGLQPLFRA